LLPFGGNIGILNATIYRMKNNTRVQSFWIIIVALLLPIAGTAMMQTTSTGDRALNDYLKGRADDPIARLQQKVDEGTATLPFDKKWGYLPAVLRAMKIPESTQGLVFSKTSFQIDHISRRTPRALYYNDDVYVGWVQGGPVLELASVDPVLGTVFYTLPQKASDRPQFERLNEGCLVCHDSSSTGGVPGLLMRSLLVDVDGNPILSAGSTVMTDRSPLNERFGGWYVTGTTGSQYHRGNSYYPDVASALGNPNTYVSRMNLAATSNLMSIPDGIDTTPYLTKHSDIAALLVLTHQTQIHNLITRVSYEVRTAIQDEGVDPPVSDITRNRIRNATEPLVTAMLFGWTPELTAPVSGTSGFAAEFAKLGPFDRQGRTLRELDLKKRLFRYPLSYVIYTESFNSMPKPAKDYVYKRFREILTGADKSMAFNQLSDSDRTAILQILEDTKPDFMLK
jgi:hypothetical protein